MKMSHPIIAAFVAIFVLEGCSTAAKSNHPAQVASSFIHKQQVVATTQETYPAKSPHKVTVYSQNKTPHAAYRVIGVATVSKYNLFGAKREEATIHEMMKKLAASIGGDGLINVNGNDEMMQGHVIAFQKILI